MKPYTANTNSGRTKARDDIHHGSADGGNANRAATAKAQRKAARRWAHVEPSSECDPTDLCAGCRCKYSEELA